MPNTIENESQNCVQTNKMAIWAFPESSCKYCKYLLIDKFKIACLKISFESDTIWKWSMKQENKHETLKNKKIKQNSATGFIGINQNKFVIIIFCIIMTTF